MFIHHLQSAVHSLSHLVRAPFASLITCLVIGTTIAFPAVLFVTLKNIENVSQHFRQSMQLTLYLKKNITEKRAQALQTNLQNWGESKLISPDEGLKELQEQEGFKGLQNALPKNPLPWAIVMMPNKNMSTAQIEKLTVELQNLPEVDSLQLDMTWVKRLESLIEIAHRAVYTLAFFLGFAVLIVVNNVVRTTTHHHQKAIRINQLIGDSYRLIRRPFLYAGMLYGLLGSLVAWLLVNVVLWVLKKPVHELAETYNNGFQLSGLSSQNVLTLLAIGAALGLLGSWLAVLRYIKK
jgi:cell division transport system permease protein